MSKKKNINFETIKDKLLLGLVLAVVILSGLLYGKTQGLILGSSDQQLPLSIVEIPTEEPTIEPEASTPTPIPTLIPTYIPRPTAIPTNIPYPTIKVKPTQSIPVITIKTVDYATRLKKCLTDEENDPLTKEADLAREEYNNASNTVYQPEIHGKGLIYPPASRAEEIEAIRGTAIAKLAGINQRLAGAYNCFAPTTPKPTALCNDHTYSYSQDRNGTCSYHGGVAAWYVYVFN